MAGKNHLERIFFIDSQIRYRGFVKKADIQEKYGISLKSIERDFEYMRERLYAPLEYSKFENHYYYKDEGYFLPDIFLSDKEIISLIIGEQFLENYKKTPVYEEIKAAYEKLLEHLPDQLSVSISDIKNKISIVDTEEAEIDNKVWNLLLSAIQNNKTVNIKYKRPGSKSYKTIIAPYHLASHQGNWYLIGKDDNDKNIKTYAVSRIKEAVVLNKCFSIPLNFNINNHVDLSFGIFSSEIFYNFKIIFNSEVADYIYEKKWHKKQVIKQLKNGDLLVTFISNQFDEVKFKVLRWGEYAEVIEPEELRSSIKETINNMRGIYK